LDRPAAIPGNQSLQRLVDYYDAAASTFDVNYGRVAGATTSDDLQYNSEREMVENTVRRFGGGEMVDLGAGTGYWLPMYAPNVSRAVLIEPSAEMRRAIRARIESLHMHDLVSVVAGSHLDLPQGRFDSALISGVLGHYVETDRANILRCTASALRPGGAVLVVDSVWNERASRLLPGRTGYATRSLAGGEREVFKHYFTVAEARATFVGTQFNLDTIVIGRYFWLAQGTT
jgi:SAM-dependent methyltransferase